MTKMEIVLGNQLYRLEVFDGIPFHIERAWHISNDGDLDEIDTHVSDPGGRANIKHLEVTFFNQIWAKIIDLRFGGTLTKAI